MDTASGREELGRIVRDAWVQWASEQPDPKRSWLIPWEELDDGQREVDMRIGEAVASAVAAQPPESPQVARILLAAAERAGRQVAG